MCMCAVNTLLELPSFPTGLGLRPASDNCPSDRSFLKCSPFINIIRSKPGASRWCQGVMPPFVFPIVLILCVYPASFVT